MTRERYRFGAVLFGLIAQIVGGIVAFGLAPHVIFADIATDDLARLCLRLAVYSNASMALLVALVLFFARQTRSLRWIAAAGALYHLLAGVDALRTVLGFVDVALNEPVFGPAALHGLTFVVLLAAALISEKKTEG